MVFYQSFLSFPVFSFSFLFGLFIFLLVFIICLIFITAYFTLLERKIIAAIQLRRGPDFFGFFGLFQPLLDAFKLIFKEVLLPKASFPFIFLISPFFVFFLSLLCWLFVPLGWFGSFFSSNLSFLWFFVFSSLNVYSLFFSGWASNSKYALLVSIRSIAQLISYEIAFVFLFLPFLFLNSSLDIFCIVSYQFFFGSWNYIWAFPNVFLIFISILAETNRSPFDLPEAEAELVAGYNVEYSSIPFAYFFLGEYLNIFIMSTIFVLFFLGGWGFFSFFLALSLFFLKFF